MRRRKSTLLLLTTVGMLLIASATQAAVIAPKDSATFGYKYEADAMPSTAEWVLTDAGTPGGTGFAVANGELSYVTTAKAGGRWCVSKTGAFTPSGDYTVEMRFKVTAGTGTEDGVNVFLGNGTVNCDGIFTISQNTIVMGGNAIASGLDNSGMHIYRFAYTNSKFSVWRDGQLVGENLAGMNYQTTRIMWGDGSSITAGGGSLDYLRYDTTGAYSPVPEPATMSLLAIGGLCALRRRRNG